MTRSMLGVFLLFKKPLNYDHIPPSNCHQHLAWLVSLILAILVGVYLIAILIYISIP